MEQFQALIGIAPWTMIFTLLNLVLTLYVVKHFFFERIQGVVEKRKQLTEEKMRKADAAKEEAYGMKTEYENNMAAAKANGIRILIEAREKASEERDEMVRTAQQEVQSMKMRAEKEIDREKKAAAFAIRQEMGTLAIIMAGKVIEREIKEKDHEKLIQEMIQNAGDGA